MHDLVDVFRRWQQGDSSRQIAKSLGMSRNTVRGYLRTAEGAGLTREVGWTAEQWAAFVRQRFPETESAAARAVWWTELDQHRDEIVRQLKENRVTTVWGRMHNDDKVIHCSLSTFRRYVQASIPQEVDPGRVAIHGVECAPGELAEVDFGKLGRVPDPATGKPRTLWAFILVLVYSRHLFVAPVLRLDQETWLRCHLMALDFFAGRMRRIVLDNLKDGVIKANLYDPRLNRAYREWGRYYDILLDPARSGEPTDKPHVERVVPFVREHMFRGREERFPDLRTGEAWAAQWCREEAGARIHRTTGRRPLELFLEAEAPVLRPLPTQPWELCFWERMTVARDSSCLVAGARYSVPWRLLDQTLDARVTTDRVEFFRETDLVKTHPRAPRGGQRLDDADLPQERIAFFRRTAPWCRTQAEKLGPEVLATVAELLEVGTNARLRQAQRVLDLEATFGDKRLNAACARARAFGDARYLTIKNILVAGLDQQPAEVPLLPPEWARQAGAFLRGPEAFGGPARTDTPARPHRAGPVETESSTGSTLTAPAPDGTAPEPAGAPPMAGERSDVPAADHGRTDGEAERVPETPPVAPDGVLVAASRS